MLVKKKILKTNQMCDPHEPKCQAGKEGEFNK